MKIEDIYKIENELKGKQMTLQKIDDICTSYGAVTEYGLKDSIRDNKIWYLVPDDSLTYIETTFIVEFEEKKTNRDLLSSVVLVKEIKK